MDDSLFGDDFDDDDFIIDDFREDDGFTISSLIPFKYQQIFGKYPLEDECEIVKCRRCGSVLLGSVFDQHLDECMDPNTINTFTGLRTPVPVDGAKRFPSLPNGTHFDYDFGNRSPYDEESTPKKKPKKKTPAKRKKRKRKRKRVVRNEIKWDEDDYHEDESIDYFSSDDEIFSPRKKKKRKRKKVTTTKRKRKTTKNASTRKRKTTTKKKKATAKKKTNTRAKKRTLVTKSKPGTKNPRKRRKTAPVTPTNKKTAISQSPTTATPTSILNHSGGVNPFFPIPQQNLPQPNSLGMNPQFSLSQMNRVMSPVNPMIQFQKFMFPGNNMNIPVGVNSQTAAAQLRNAQFLQQIQLRNLLQNQVAQQNNNQRNAVVNRSPRTPTTQGNGNNNVPMNGNGKPTQKRAMPFVPQFFQMMYNPIALQAAQQALKNASGNNPNVVNGGPGAKANPRTQKQQQQQGGQKQQQQPFFMLFPPGMNLQNLALLSQAKMKASQRQNVAQNVNINSARVPVRVPQTQQQQRPPTQQRLPPQQQQQQQQQKQQQQRKQQQQQQQGKGIPQKYLKLQLNPMLPFLLRNLQNTQGNITPQKQLRNVPLTQRGQIPHTLQLPTSPNKLNGNRTNGVNKGMGGKKKK